MCVCVCVCVCVCARASQTAGSKLNEHYGEKVYQAKLKIFLTKVGYFAGLIDINVCLFHIQTRCWRPKRTAHVQVKVKVTLAQAMKAQTESTGIALLCL